MDLVAVHIAKVAVLYYTIAKEQDASHTVFGGFHMKKNYLPVLIPDNT